MITAQQSKDSVIMRDYLSMKELIKKTSLISFITDNKGGYISSYIIELNITTVSNIYEDNEPILADNFRLWVTYPNRLPYQPIIRVHDNSELIFHPHFKYSNRSILPSKNLHWVDYQEYDASETLAELIVRIAKSLQYNNSYISLDTYQIANKEAQKWCSFIMLYYPHKFPIDKVDIFNLQYDSLTEQKKFNVSNLSEAINIKKKFDVSFSTNSYTPIESPKPLVEVLNPKSSIRHGHNQNQVLYIKPQARENLLTHIGWERITDNNINEQGGLLIGNVYKDSQNQLVFGIVDAIVEAEYTSSNSIHLNMTHQTWNTMLGNADKLIRENGNMKVIGWYHTHPNNLDVFMSGTDLATQKRLFNKDWNFAVVLNPHHKIWRVFYGENAKECEGYFISQLLNQEHEHNSIE